MSARPLSGQVAVVAGATRGAGRGIARMLGEAGATVYCTGRSTRAAPATEGRPETIDETAELVTSAGGRGIAVQVDHLVEEQVAALFERVHRDEGRLDVLVNDIWGGDDLMEWKPFWQLSVEKGLRMQRSAVNTHVITSRYGVPLMVERDRGLIVEVTDGDFAGYRGTLFYDLAKSTVIRLAYAMSKDLRHTGITSLAVTPGYLRSEAMLDRFGVTEERWREAIAQDAHFSESETPAYVGRGVAALAADPAVRTKAGRVFASWTLAKEYGFRDVDGRQPDWGTYLPGVIARILNSDHPLSAEETFLLEIRAMQQDLDTGEESRDERARIEQRLRR